MYEDQEIALRAIAALRRGTPPHVEAFRRSTIESLRAADDSAAKVRLTWEIIHLTRELIYDEESEAIRPEYFAECEALLGEAEQALLESAERYDGFAWLSLHTALRRILVVEGHWADAAAATDRHLARLRATPDADKDAIAQLEEFRDIDAVRTDAQRRER